jgi:cytochrome b
MNQQRDKKKILVWDRATRTFHWSLVTLVILCWLTAEAGSAWFWTHLVAGYGILLLVLFRLIWGVMGNRHARFSNFVCGWREVREHAVGLLGLTPPRHVGHNPLGGWMILTLLTGLIVLVVTGLFAADDEVAGAYAVLIRPGIADALAEIHETLYSILWLFVALHIIGVLTISLLGRENLVRAMWTGIKRVSSDNPEPDAPEPSTVRYLIAILLAAMGLAAVIWGAPG